MSKSIGLYINKKRKAAGLTQQELAEKTGCSRSEISNIETGESEIPRYNLGTFAKVLGVDPSELMGDSNTHLGFLIDMEYLTEDATADELKKIIEATRMVLDSSAAKIGGGGEKTDF